MADNLNKTRTLAGYITPHLKPGIAVSLLKGKKSLSVIPICLSFSFYLTRSPFVSLPHPFIFYLTPPFTFLKAEHQHTLIIIIINNLYQYSYVNMYKVVLGQLTRLIQKKKKKRFRFDQQVGKKKFRINIVP